MKNLIAACALAAAALGSPLSCLAENQPPLPTPAQRFHAGSLLVQRFGDAGKPALVFIPGLTCGPWEWSREIAAFSKTYTVYALTLPGFDGEAPAAAPLFSTVSNDFWTMIAAQHIDRPVLVGHSLGGTLSLLLATQHADRLRAAIAVDGLPVFPGFQDQTAAQRSAAAAQMTGSFAAIKTPAQFAAVEQSFVLPYLVTSPADAAAIAPLTARSSPTAAAAWMTEDFESDFRPSLKNATIPILEIAPYDAQVDARAAADAPGKQKLYASLLAGAPHARVVMIPDSRHFIMYDRAQALDAAIGTFLSHLP